MLSYTTEMIPGHPLGSFFWEKGIKKGQLRVCVCVCVCVYRNPIQPGI